MRLGVFVIAFAVATTGCLAGVGNDLSQSNALAFVVKDASGAPAPLALVEAQDAAGATLWLASTDLAGALDVAVGDNVATLVVWRDGVGHALGDDGVLTPLEDAGAPPVGLSATVAFPNPSFPVQLGTTCTEKTDGDTSCGLDEPSVVVDGNGRVFYTAACCFLVSSPVFVSEDGGATFRELAHPLKDSYGNEGDLAIDDEGNLYYMDIDLATFGIARWTPDLEPAYGYRRPGEPLVDRPWIRAGAGGVVHAVYNTGVDTVYYRSTDYAMTFDAAPTARYGSGLAGAYSDVRNGIVGMYGNGDFMESVDAGATWGERSTVEGCAREEASLYQTEGVAVDEAGTRWHLKSGCVVARHADGAWGADQRAIPEGIDVFFSWMGAGAPGGVAVAYYGRVADASVAESLGVEPDAWYVFVSWSTDAASATPHWATLLAVPEPIGHGELGRRLGDFMMAAVGPDGAVHVAYAANPEMDDSATASYVRTTPVPGMAPSIPLVGPFEG